MKFMIFLFSLSFMFCRATFSEFYQKEEGIYCGDMRRQFFLMKMAASSKYLHEISGV